MLLGKKSLLVCLLGLLLLPACEEEPPTSSPPPPPCQFHQLDTDCDTVLNGSDQAPGFNDLSYDHDGDAIPVFFDRFQGNDYADDDGDGIANWADTAPSNPDATLAQPIQPSAVEQQQEAELAEAIVKQDMAVDAYKEFLEHDGDTDGDGFSDFVDDAPTLPDNEDYDRDGYSTGEDAYPQDDDAW